MRIYKLLNFNPEIRDGGSYTKRLRQRLLAKVVNLLASIEDRSTQETLDLFNTDSIKGKKENGNDRTQ
jgi:hypothetical protein